MYGKIIDSRANTMVADADADMPVLAGGKFVPAPMHYFTRFSGADGMHGGYLPGYPASHGCVRMPEQFTIAFFNAINVGTPVTVWKDADRALPGAIGSDISVDPGSVSRSAFRSETSSAIAALVVAIKVDPKNAAEGCQLQNKGDYRVCYALWPLFSRLLNVICAGRLRSTREINQVGQDVERFIAFRIYRRCFAVIIGVSATD